MDRKKLIGYAVSAVIAAVGVAGVFLGILDDTTGGQVVGAGLVTFGLAQFGPTVVRLAKEQREKRAKEDAEKKA